MTNEEWINMFINKFNESKDYRITDISDREKLLDELRPTGEWISHYDYCAKHGVIPSALITFWWCSQCEQAVAQPTNFCPKCKAKMIFTNTESEKIQDDKD